MTVEKILEELNNCPVTDEYSQREFIQSLAKKYSLKFASGETRFCLYDRKWNFVLKMTRIGRYKTDFCKKELANYESAKKYGVERICLPIKLLYTCTSGMEVYQQTRYSTDHSDAVYKKSYDKYLERRYGDLPRKSTVIPKIRANIPSGMDKQWLARVLQLYGKKFCKSMELWLNENRINDLHDANIGWLNNKPVILDYAGFRRG